MTPKPRRAKGDGGIYQRKDGMWIGTVELPQDNLGNRKRPTVSSMKKDVALQKLRELQRLVDDGLAPVSGKTTVEAWLTRWLTEFAQPRLKPTTYATYRSTVKRQIVPAIGNKALAKLTPADIRAMVKRIETTHTTRTSQATYNVLAKALKDAKREGLIRENPAERVDRPAALSQDRGTLTLDQIKRLFTFLTSTDDPLTARWAMALLTGARQAECLGLEWERIDFTEKTIDISWTLRRLKLKPGVRPMGEVYPRSTFDVPAAFDFRPVWRAVCLIPPKTVRSRRIVPMIPPLEAALLAHRERTAGVGLVWTRGDGTPVVPADDTGAWRETLVAAGLYSDDDETAVPTLHAARHTLATVLQDVGVPEAVRMAIMGHSSVAAHRGYAHVDQSLARSGLGELGRLLGE